MGSDAIALNFSNKLDSTDCSIWVLERSIFKSDMIHLNQFKFLVFDNIKRVFRRFAFIEANIFFLKCFKS